MNIFKTPNKKKCAFIYMNELSEVTDRMINNLDKNYDVYVYFHKKLNIYVSNYCSLNPVTGFIEGSKDNAEGIWELITSVANGIVPNTYFLYYFPVTYSIDQDNIEEVMAGGLLEKSILLVENIPYNEKMRVYKKNKWDWIKFWTNKTKGINSTNYTCNDMVILYNDIETMIKGLDSNYIKSFEGSTIRTLLPSAFHYLNIKYLNAEVHHLKDTSL